jgi:hypothetical protein
MIISDEQYNNLKLQALGLQTALNVNIVNINIAKNLVDTILNLQSDQPDIPVPQPILAPKEQLNKIFGSEAFNNQPKRELTEDLLSPYSIHRLFADYLKDTYDIDKPFIHRWEPKDRLSEDQLKEIFNISKNNNFEMSFEKATEVFFAVNRENFDLLTLDIKMVVNNFYKKYEQKYPNIKSIVDENGIDFYNTFVKTLNYNENAKGLLNQTYLTRLDIVLYDSNKGGYYKDDCINWLLKTQGYTKEYLYSKDELNKSTFLSSFYDALSKADANLILRGNSYELVILAYTDCFDHAIALGDKKNIVINKSATLFFRDKIEGTLGPAIHLDSNIIVDENTSISDIRFNCNIMPYGREAFDLRIVNTN